MIVVDEQPRITYLSGPVSYVARKISRDEAWAVSALHGRELHTDLPLIRAEKDKCLILACTTKTLDGHGIALARLADEVKLQPKFVKVQDLPRLSYLRDLAVLDARRVIISTVFFEVESEKSEYQMLVVDQSTGRVLSRLRLPCEEAPVVDQFHIDKEWLPSSGEPRVVVSGTRVCAYWIAPTGQTGHSLVFSACDLSVGASWSPVRTIYSGGKGRVALHSAAIDPQGALHFSWFAESDDSCWNVYYARSRQWQAIDSLQIVTPQSFPIGAWPGFWGRLAVDDKRAYLAWPVYTKEMRGIMVSVAQHSE